MPIPEAQFQKRLGELIAKIETLPPEEQEKLAPLVDETRARHSELRETSKVLHDGLASLNLSIKYLLFDLKATRRENTNLRRRLGSDD